MKMLTFVLSMFFSLSVYAGPSEPCTKEPKEKWQDQEKFKANLVQSGYKIKVFKVTKGDCYEIYGWDKAGEKVEIYFNPVDGSIIREIRK